MPRKATRVPPTLPSVTVSPQQYFELHVPGRPTVKLTAYNEDHLARQVMHRDLGGTTSRKLAHEAWISSVGAIIEDSRGTTLKHLEAGSA
ncbi:hypothetical protein [Deinococcus peraridilitoris]|uniref:Uncharacterized protein n=1 Tax=Deinococcus peraridilitoris (strain DSM 19664 / LMG 22246 / CIP 109416 / KR-200) TaxID=937777 RepID=K9ZZR0_DEIPD|nr:hypothetical protein [Deinococcus peraridilitoris]AFZ67103.1 hypothetical protein Deipe_1562 [Deinococcus peraridilitoris DSM 19664]